jgi:hypothetical protein
MNPQNVHLGFQLVSSWGSWCMKKGIEVGQKSFDAIDKAVPPTTKTELQSLIDKINFIRRFISNLSASILPFFALLKLKSDQEFRWSNE